MHDEPAERIRELEAALSAAEARAARLQDILGRSDLLNEELAHQVKRLEAELQASAGELSRARQLTETIAAENTRLRAHLKNLETAQRQPDRAGPEPDDQAEPDDNGDGAGSWVPKRAS
jgi:chromosome segregation ATPase